MDEMSRFDKMLKCQSFFDSLAYILSPEYEVVASCNADESRYLVPKGTADQITYHSKPAKSFRVSGHWNWYSNLKKNPDPNYVQCFSVDAPGARRRESSYATKPRNAVQVCVIGEDGKYHCVFGEVFDRRTKTWSFIAPEAMDIARRYMNG